MISLRSKELIPTRLVIGVMIFLACFIAYTSRVNMSINLIAMVEPDKTSNGQNSVAECLIVNQTYYNGSEYHEKLTGSPDYGTRYPWASKLQGLILGSYFWGYIITCIPGGLLAENFGPTRTVMISTLISGALTLLGPLMASWHYSALIVSRFLTGLCGGVIYPCLHCLVSRWAPPDEKGKFVGALLGGTLGTVVTWPLLGAIIEFWGWSWSFFINGGIILIWCVFWILLVADSPEKHPRITDEEKLFIEKSLGNKLKKNIGLPPYKQMALSVPFWALTILHFGNLWGLFFLMTAGPNFLSSVLGFNLGHTGVLASLPYLARLIFGFIFGLIGDFLRKKQFVSLNLVRKCFVLFSHIIPGLLLLVLIATGCDVNWAVVLLTLSLGSNGASTLTNLQNNQDLAPNFAGTIYGIINCVGSTTGFITPLITGYLTAEHNGLNEWHTIFIIGAIVYIICGIVFVIFGSAELQKWNEIEQIESNSADGLQNPTFTEDDGPVKLTNISENTKV